MPQRIQRKRSKGWTMPENAVYVGRPTRYGNPFHLIDYGGRPAVTTRGGSVVITCDDIADARATAVREYRVFLAGQRMNLSSLRGKDLACWCPLDQPCHVDVLLELANR